MCEHCCHDEDCSEIKSLISISVAVLLSIIAYFTKCNILYIFAYLIAGWDIILVSIKNIGKKNFFDENLLMTVATVGALFLGEFPEAVSVMILYKIGEFLQDKAVDKSRNSIEELMNITPDYANIEINGELKKVMPYDVHVNDIIVVKAGEKVPLDGIVLQGSSYADTSSLTGESEPKLIQTGDAILSGYINLNGILKIRTQKEYQDSTVSKILKLIENAQEKKSVTENFITKFARYYTPCVVFSAVGIMLLPFIFHLNVHIWIERALTFLVISCPCALVISVPLTFFCAIGRSSKDGILVKGSSYLEKIAQVKTIAFDKTGTLTTGKLSVNEVKSYSNEDISSILKYAAYTEYYSNHPIASAIKSKFDEQIDITKISDVKEIAGYGISALIDGNEIIAGNKKMMQKYDIEINEETEHSSVVYIVKNKLLIGCIIISDEIKPQACELISKLKKLKVHTVMLTGDTYKSACNIAKEIGIDEFYADLLPQDKTQKIEEFIEKSNKNQSTVFAGDGINDAPVLMRSDAGIGMGALGSDSAIEAADVVISDDNIFKIYKLILIAKKTIKIAKQNITLAIGVKILFLILSVYGCMTMWGAIFADTGIALIAIINSLRCYKTE